MSPLKTRLYRLLRASEKYTKTDMVYLASGGFWSTLAQVVNTLIVLGFAVFVAHVLPKDVYGSYKYIIATVGLLGAFSLTGVGTATFQSIASGFDGSLREGFWQNLKWSILAFLGAFVLAAYYFTQGNTMLAFGFLVGGTFSPLLASANLAGAFLNAKKDFRRSALYFGILETFLSTLALVMAMLLTKNPAILAGVYFLGNTLATLWIYRRVVRAYHPDPAKTDAGMMRYAKHLSLMGILSGIAGKIDQVLLFHFVGPVQLAIYNFAIAIPDQTKGPLKALNTMMQAKFVNRSDEEIRAGMRNKIILLAITSVAFIVLYIVVAPYLYAFLFPRYSAAAFFSQIYALSLLAIIVNPLTSYLLAKKKIKEQYENTFIMVVIQIVSIVLGILWFGLLGLIGARVVIRIIGIFLTMFLYKRAV